MSASSAAPCLASVRGPTPGTPARARPSRASAAASAATAAFPENDVGRNAELGGHAPAPLLQRQPARPRDGRHERAGLLRTKCVEDGPTPPRRQRAPDSRHVRQGGRVRAVVAAPARPAPRARGWARPRDRAGPRLPRAGASQARRHLGLRGDRHRPPATAVAAGAALEPLAEVLEQHPPPARLVRGRSSSTAAIRALGPAPAFRDAPTSRPAPAPA